MLKEFPRRLAIGLLHQLRHRELAGSVNGHKEKQLSYFSSDFGDIDMKIANGISFELLTFGLVPIHVCKAENPVMLQVAMQRRSCGMWN